MSVQIALVLAVLVGTIVTLATGVLRADITAVLVLVLVSLLGLAPQDRVIAGFANPAVLTIGGMFVISAGLSRTGVAELLGRWLVRVAGHSELRIVTAVTGLTGLLSGFVNNIGVAAMMLPVVVTVARQVGLPASKLLIPMALGAQLGGFTTLIGTAPNLLASDALREAGWAPFSLFSYAPVGLVLLAAGTAFVALLGPRLLPDRAPATGATVADRPGIRGDVEIGDRLFRLAVPEGSLLAGRTLGESLIGSALGVHVLAVQRSGATHRAPGPEWVLEAGDSIIVHGRPDYFMELRGRRHLALDRDERVRPEWLESAEIGLARARVSGGGEWTGRTAADMDLRAREGVFLLSLLRGDDLRLRTRLVDAPLDAGDVVLLQGPRDRLQALGAGRNIERLEFLTPAEALDEFDLGARLWSLRVTEDSLLEGRTLGSTRLGDAGGFLVLAVSRAGEEEAKDGKARDGASKDGESGRIHLLPGPDLELHRGDQLMVKAKPLDLAVLRGLQRLDVDLDSDVDPTLLEGGDAGFAEVVIAPHSALIGKTLRQASFRDRFGLHVVAIVREGEVVQSNLREETLRFGDALLLYGSRRPQRALMGEPDLIPLQSPKVEAPHFRLAPLSLIVTAVALLPVLLGILPVQVGVLTGALLMILTRCLKPEEAYRAVHLPSIVLIAGMLSLGAALDETGAVDLMGSILLGAIGDLGPLVVLAVLVFTAGALAQILPGVALVVLMAPIAIAAAEVLAVSPYPLVMAVGIAGTSVASPVSQPAHALTMAPGGYRMGDYLRLGLPITVMVLVLTVLVTPLFVPF